MKKIDSFINLYPVQKTLRFSLIPIGKTEENFNNKLLLNEDKKRAEEYEKVKTYIDRYHKVYIESVLSKFILDGIREYADLYYKHGKSDKDIKAMEKAESAMRKSISKALTKTDLYKKMSGQEMIKEILPEFLSDEEELAAVEMFRNFTTYFKGFSDNRKNMYSEEAQSTAISYRCINENLPKFLDNCLNFKKIIENLPEEQVSELNENCYNVYGFNVWDMFSIDYFSFVLSQSGIDKYNGIIGGYSCSDGQKVKGINELVNLYNQQVAKADKSKRLPLMKSLYKQILSEKGTVSFIPEKFNSDNEVLSNINEYYITCAKSAIGGLVKIFNEIDTYNLDGIFIKNGLAITDISNAVFGSWSVVSEAWNIEYDTENAPKNGKFTEKYYDNRQKEYKKTGSFSISYLQNLILHNLSEIDAGNIAEYYKAVVSEKAEKIQKAYASAENLLSTEYEGNYDKKLCRNDEAIELAKALLDEIKELERILKPLSGTGKEETKDDTFYGEFLPEYEKLSSLDRLYDKVRNYITQKPYSKDKIKLNFENPQLLDGWDKNKERDYRTVLLKKDGKYYLAIMDKTNNKAFLDPPADDGSECFEKVEYKLLPLINQQLPRVFFCKKNIEYFSPSDRILEIRKNETFKKGDNFNLNDCHEFIDFFKASIEKHEDWSQFGFRFSPTESYNDISEFYNEVSKQGYTIKFKKIPCSYINELVEGGQLYLFQIYNKDFSPHSKGTPNLHTLYLKMLFDERNLENVVYQLNGGAEMFYREASIREKEKIVHPANTPIETKNPDSKNKTSLFPYDITKDKRFTKRQFSLHFPITLNFKADGNNFINNDVRRALKESEHNYIIGIDRGERNLLYISVINEKGEIAEQKSLNEIIGTNNCIVDYHKLLDSKEKERDKARKSWGTVENIKELKEGYLSQIVHEICNLVIKYDAVIAMEELNFGFKKGRFKVEKQVYQKFENMLIEKLNYLVDKKLSPEENGGLLKAYQLTNKVDGVNKGRQNGIIFFVPAWLTSKIDPTTGFINLLYPKYTSVQKSVEFFGKFDNISYNEQEDMFEFEFDYSNFSNSSLSFRKHWTLFSNSDRIETFRNPEKNSEWDNRRVVLTEEFKTLFNDYSIDYRGNLKEAILSNDKKDFHYRLTKLFSLILQMRNSETGNRDVDYLISPIKNSNGEFFDSRNCTNESALPTDADANGAYNIARKALWAINVLKETDTDELRNADLYIRNADWLKFAQE